MEAMVLRSASPEAREGIVVMAAVVLSRVNMRTTRMGPMPVEVVELVVQVPLVLAGETVD